MSDEAQLEARYRNTWLCTNCNERHSVTMSICPYPPLIECAECGGSGFSTPGTGYGNVCGNCGGLRMVPR